MSQDYVKYGDIEIHFPNVSLNVFSIFTDLAERFGVEYQSDAVSILKSELKKQTDMKPKPNIDFESDRTSIHSRNADTMLKVAEIINRLVLDEFRVVLSTDERKAILEQMKGWKRPKKQAWAVGDVFSMELTDGTFMFGQILDSGLSKGCAVLVGFELRKAMSMVSMAELKRSKMISILHYTCNCLDSGAYPVLFKAQPVIAVETDNRTHSIEENGFRASISGAKAVVNKYFSTSDAVLLELCKAYYGLTPWNVYKAGHYDEMLLPGRPVPKTAQFLDPNARNKYRLEHFGLDEHNNRVGNIL
ncbi:MAG: hypothetical protein AB7U63_13630 [Porticoccaceae bacterium]